MRITSYTAYSKERKVILMKLSTNWFYGNEASDYAKEHGYLDYGTLAKAFNCVLNNGIMSATAEVGYWECVSGNEYDEETDTYAEIFQNYIVDEAGAEILQEAGEIVYYNEALDMYIWGVTHYGTAWDYVLTNSPLNCGYEEQ